MGTPQAGLLSNQFVSGGLLLMLSGSLIALLRNVPLMLWTRLKTQFMVSVTINDRDPLFEWVTLWLDRNPYSKRARSVIATTKNDSDEIRGCSPVWNPSIVFSPARGQHFFFYNNTLIWLTREKEDKQGTPGSGDGKTGDPMHLMRSGEIYVFRTPGRTQEPIRKLIDDVLAATRKDRDEKIAVYVSAWGSWEKLYSYTTRPLESIILSARTREDVCRDLQKFLGDRRWYVSRGIPYRIGFLFHGPPGNGKTSTVEAIAGHLKLNLYCLNLSARSIDDSQLARLVQGVKANSILLLEDIDAVLPARQVQAREVASKNPVPAANGEKEEQGVTLSGVLNVLDGVLTPDGLIVMMTTNYPDRLDSALVRPGRIDKSIKFDNATRDQCIRSFNWFYPDCNHGAAETFADSLDPGSVSMARVQEQLMMMREQKEDVQ